MAKRPTRRIIVDRLEATVRLLERAEDQLARASALYYERGAKEGALVDQLSQAIKLIREQVIRFRRERA